MDKTRNKKIEIKTVLDLNKNLFQRMESEKWTTKYSKRTDMIIMGKTFPSGSFYQYVGDTGVMLRIDKDKKIYGFAIENTKFFMKENPEVGFAIYPFVHPYRFMFMSLFSKILISNRDETKSIGAVSDYVAGRVQFA